MADDLMGPQYSDSNTLFLWLKTLPSYTHELLTVCGRLRLVPVLVLPPQKKHTTFKDRSLDFKPFSIEKLGPFGSSALKLFDSIARRARVRTGDAGASIRLVR